MNTGNWITDRLNRLEYYAQTAPRRHWVRKGLAGFGLILAIMVSNLVALVRWPWARWRQSRTGLAPDSPISVNEPAELDARIAGHRRVLVDFHAQRCGPCVMMEGALQRVAEREAGTWTVVKVDVSTRPQASRNLGVRGLPTLIMFRDSSEVDRFAGALTEQQLGDWLADHT